MSPRMRIEYLEFFNDAIKKINEAQEAVYKELQEVRGRFIDDDNIDGYIAMTGDLATNICKVTGRLNFLVESFEKFIEDETRCDE